MPVYEYRALNKKGRKVQGIITADGPSGARIKLSQGSVFPMEIWEVAGEEEKSSDSLPKALLGSGRVNPVEITMALRQLATLVSSGLPLLLLYLIY